MKPTAAIIMIVLLILVSLIVQGCGADSNALEISREVGTSVAATMKVESSDNTNTGEEVVDNVSTAIVETRIIDMGEIDTATTRGNLNPGEIHTYTYKAESSSHYNKVAFAIGSEDFVVKGNVEVEGRNYDGEIIPDLPTRYRIPPLNDTGKISFCLEGSSITYEKIFTITVSSQDIGSGEYSITLMADWSRATVDNCLVLLGQNDAVSLAEAPTIAPTNAPTKAPTEVPTQVPTQGPTYWTIRYQNNCDKVIFTAIHYLDLDGNWVTVGWWELAPGDTAKVANTQNRKYLVYAQTEDGSLKWGGVDGDYYKSVKGSSDLYPFKLITINANEPLGTHTEAFQCP